MEILCDSVLEFVPAQTSLHLQHPMVKSDEPAQGILTVHKLPIHNERGGGMDGKGCRENLSFKLSPLKGLIIKPFSLPPVRTLETTLTKTIDNSVLF